MTDAGAIEAATKRLTQALDGLQAAAERRREADRAEHGLADQLHALGADRSRLASDLDAVTARARALETTNHEVARRLDAAIETIRSVIEANDS
jgi:flagellar motility protein MotE (MotC chaperone)